MPHFDERAVGDLTVRIDRDLCVGFGDCITAEPMAFDFDEEGVAVFLESVVKLDRARLLDACAACPVDAISLLDAAGQPLSP